MLDAESEVHRAVTEAWVSSDPLEITFRRTVWENAASGGRIDAGKQTLEAQTFRMDARAEGVPNVFTTPDGRLMPKRFRLVGQPDADVQQGDEFNFMGAPYEVTNVPRRTFERTVAEVEHRG